MFHHEIHVIATVDLHHVINSVDFFGDVTAIFVVSDIVTQLFFVTLTPGPHVTFGVQGYHMVSSGGYFYYCDTIVEFYLSNVDLTELSLIQKPPIWDEFVATLRRYLSAQLRSFDAPGKEATIGGQQKTIGLGECHLCHETFGRIIIYLINVL